MSRRAVFWMLAVFVTGAGVVPAFAAEQASPEVALMAGSCANCHGPDGRSPGPIPPIAGMPQDYLEERLLAFKGGGEPDITVMVRIAKGFSEDDLKALAAHFSEFEP